MIDSEEIKSFFDRLAPQWDRDMIKDDAILNTILDNAHVGAGSRVLDVATGTGLLIPYYLERGVESVTAVDFSEEMINIARSKFDYPNVRIICEDIEKLDADELYDALVVYNAFPHFPDGDRLIKHLASLVRPGGIVTVAHGMSRDRINDHHRGGASRVSNGLMPASDLADIFAKYTAVDIIIDNSTMYQVTGVAR